jgi:hypothetical protein
MTHSFTVPDGLSFETALSVSQALLDEMEQGNLTEAQTGEAIAALVATENGARGFFVTYLSDARPWADQPTRIVLDALASSPAVVSPLLVKNLVMSTAMAITHRRDQNEHLAEGSDQVKARSLNLLQHLTFPELKQQAQEMATSLETGRGSYQPFLDRWQYDPEQRHAMLQALTESGILPCANEGD